ncbi:effector-associated constant component EACC1 [Nonomuraea ceibae]|uniref:effector-associated constant component EACC1 n=1 Tax=Nonomuraea ceibae TaxID=1935170 RepID=UPI001C5FA58F|nr:hypothetical protein [Nonomuraea ceibae]
METRLTVVGDGDKSEHLESLRDWLGLEPELGGQVRKSAPPPRDGELGGLTDAVVIALGSGTLSALAMSLKTWLSQPRRSDITIRVEAGDRSIEIDAKRVAESRIEALLEQALRDESSG